ncbi:MAG: hypothetical protein AAGD22_04965 [Verrucomicrobiota bacterium]
MNETEHESIGSGEPSADAESSVNGDMDKDRRFESVGDALRKGQTEAEELARKVVPKAKSAVQSGVYDVAYAAAFVAGFGVTVFKEVVPKAAKQGVGDGVKAGEKAATEFAEGATGPDEVDLRPEGA